jgi:A/G-specific adenine glycosylase
MAAVEDAPGFADRVIAWQRVHGRHDLPWQGGRDPYRIWLSEIMLQQTQVATVIPYYQRFLREFPDVASLAAAPLERVLELWSGLGYYRRARNLHQAAGIVMRDHGGRFPGEAAALAALPGVGRSTAAAVAVFATGERAAILDGNVRRVLCRHDALDGDPGSAAVLAILWSLAERRLPASAIEAYTQGLMDLGATVCTRARPACERCPLAATCSALAGGDPAAYPRRRRRAPPPRRELAPLIIVHPDGRVLLERRPEQGIWAGLWGLPECPAAPADAVQARDCTARVLAAAGAASQAEAPPVSVEPLPPFEHALTHFRLWLSPWRVGLAADPPPAAEPAAGYRWLAPADAGAAALPRPVRTLLAGLSPGPAASAGRQQSPDGPSDR